MWLLGVGANVFVPFGHSPDTDLVAELDGRLLRVQVKTSTVQLANGRYQVALSTKGGNRSWNGLVKRFSASRCEYLFVLVHDGRRWFIQPVPSRAACRSSSEGRSTRRSRSSAAGRSKIAAWVTARLDGPWRGSRAVKGDAL